MIIPFNSIGRNIRTLRKQNGLTQEQLAERAQMSTLHLGRIERGERIPSLPYLSRIADALHVPVRELFADSLPQTQAESTPTAFTPENIYRLIEGSSNEARRLMYSICWLIASDFKI